MRKILPLLIALMASLTLAACLPASNGGQQGSGGPGQAQDAAIINPGPSPSEDAQYDDASDYPESDGRASSLYSQGNASDYHSPSQKPDIKVKEKGQYTDKERVALYIHTYGHLPCNYITKGEAQSLGWVSSKGNLRKVAPGKSIGGDKFGNYEGQLPKAKGRKYYECDIGYTGGKRNAKRIIFSSDGLVFYTDDHYKTFEQLY